MGKVAPLQQRKADHIHINLEKDVRSALTTGLEHYHFVHEALPEIKLEDVDTSLEVFGKRLSAPVLVSSMTGGTEEAGTINRRLAEAAQQAGAQTGVIFIGRKESLKETKGFIAKWNPECVAVLAPVPNADFLLDGVTRAGLKMMLNALSTCTMVRLGRVMGNYMIWVVPSNLKLIDRSTRYIQRLTGLDYKAANQLLFEVIEYVEPRMKADQAYPPVVGVSVMRIRHKLGNEEAEKRLLAEMQLPA